MSVADVFVSLSCLSCGLFSYHWQTFTSMTGFRAHVKSRQRAGELSADAAFRSTPVEVKVLDSYLTVASTETPSSSSTTGAHTRDSKHRRLPPQPPVLYLVVHYSQVGQERDWEGGGGVPETAL